MIAYIAESGSRYAVDYQALRDQYVELVSLSDEAFLTRIPEAAHFACVVANLKGTGRFAVRDDGVVHLLLHLLHIPGEESLSHVRGVFKERCRLAP